MAERGEQWVQCAPPTQREDGRIIRFYVSRKGDIRVSVDEPPQTNIALTREAYYSREEVAVLTANVHDGIRFIQRAWLHEPEESILDTNSKPLDEQIAAEV